jgi:DNA-binding transcriptional MerR regulator
MRRSRPMACFCACADDAPPPTHRVCAESQPAMAAGFTTWEACTLARVTPQMLNKLQRLGLFRAPFGRGRGRRQFYSIGDIQRIQTLEFLKRILGLGLLKELLETEGRLAPILRDEGPGLGAFFGNGRLPSWESLRPRERDIHARDFRRYIDLRLLVHQRLGAPELLARARLTGLDGMAS